MKKIFLFSCLFVAALASCNKIEDPVTPSEANQVSISLPKLDVKTSVAYGSGAHNLYWANGDAVSAGTNNISNALEGVKDNTSATVFTFKKSVSNGDFVRFPGVKNQTALTIPNSYVSVNGQITSESAPMWGTVTFDKMTDDGLPSIELQSIMSMLKFTVTGTATIKKVSINSTAGETLNGTYTISRTGTVTAASNLKSRTDIEFQQPIVLSADKGVDIYVPIIPGTYAEGLSFKLYDSNEKLMRVAVFNKGEQLTSKDFASFNVVYTPGCQIALEPGEAFNADKLEELPEEELSYEELEVTGTIKYDDGQPAEGVRVSDGFSVVVTDAKGKYNFRSRGEDVRYIYFSYPADAKIEVNKQNDCPDFFLPYNTNKHVFNFTLKRQAVENKFAIFAMADPQTHYQKRDTQKSADTDRYGAETVPALNAEIAKQAGLACYGVSLGDITYSEGSRDSTPSMEIIRTHFGRVNMPIFNAMGNHDYTYYPKGVNIADKVASTPGSSTVNLHAQRSFEAVFGPVNFSFDRGKVHFVCMKNIHFNSTTTWDAGSYSGGFTNEEYEWLVQDLANTPKDMKVVLCVHIPISTSTSGKNVTKVQNLLRKFTNSIVFSGHTHYQRTVNEGGKLYEQIHSAVCGQWWWSKIEGDGCPNGYTVYHFNGTEIEDSYFIGVNDQMNVRDYQMRIYKGNILAGGKYAKFQMPFGQNDYLINVFNGGDDWTIKVYENGVYAGKATLIPASKWTVEAGSSGKTHTPSGTSSQDWWAIGYHIGVAKRGTSGSSYQTANYHMWKWYAKDSTAKISVEAEDPHGNVYTCDEIVTDGQNYPSYIKAPLNI
jgi:hypothetical protein